MKRLLLTLALVCGSAHADPIDDQINKWANDACDKMAERAAKIPGNPMVRWSKDGCINYVNPGQWKRLSQAQKTDLGLVTAVCACRSDVVYFSATTGELLGYATSTKYEDIK